MGAAVERLGQTERDEITHEGLLGVVGKAESSMSLPVAWSA